MNFIKNLFRSSLGKKFVLAVSGAGLLLFVVAHLLGNLQIFLGRDALNYYGHFLHTNPQILWPARCGLVVLAGLHVWSALKVSAENKAARGVGYEGNPTPVAAGYASRTMLLSGLMVAAFVVYHLLHYTAQVPAVNLTGQDFGAMWQEMAHDSQRHDVYRMMVVGFRQPLVTGFYLLGVGLLCLHLSHGLRATFQTLGWQNRPWRPVIEGTAPVVAWVIFLGYASIPLAVVVHLVKL
jgi:succinate dehydrogenase / fumarate reductase cytochrome b subunit